MKVYRYLFDPNTVLLVKQDAATGRQVVYTSRRARTRVQDHMPAIPPAKKAGQSYRARHKHKGPKRRSLRAA